MNSGQLFCCVVFRTKLVECPRLNFILFYIFGRNCHFLWFVILGCFLKNQVIIFSFFKIILAHFIVFMTWFSAVRLNGMRISIFFIIEFQVSKLCTSVLLQLFLPCLNSTQNSIILNPRGLVDMILVKASVVVLRKKFILHGLLLTQRILECCTVSILFPIF